MRSYTIQRERYHDHAMRLRFREELSYKHISKIIPVAEETIRRWCIKFAAENPERVSAMSKRTVKPEQEIAEQRPCQELPDDIKALQAELARVKEELRKEKLRADAYDTMIDIAEGMFKVPIRKKAGAKQ